jgi:hypothetical protein
MIWWIEGFRVPALVTGSDADDPEPFLAGALGEDDTTILFGNGRMNSDSYSGGRISFGHWFDACETFGIEATFFGLDKETTRYRAESDGDMVLARPFFDIGGLGAAAWPIALQDVAEGRVAVDASTDLTGVEVLFRRALMRGCDSRFDLLAGYRYAQLDDSLRISQWSTALEGADLVPVDSTLELYDQFTTRNEFHGAEIGVSSYVHRCRWSFETLMKVAFGSTRSFVDIRGGSDYSEGDLLDSGFLAQSTNIGRHSQREFTMIPELGVNLGYDLTCNLRFTFGYSLVYWSKVARPGEQIDPDLNLVRSGVVDDFPDVPPVATGDAIHPQFRINTTDVWAQGMNFGLSYHF